MIDERYLWDRLFRFVRYIDNRHQREALAAFIKENTDNKKLHAAADRLVEGWLREDEIPWDPSFNARAYKATLVLSPSAVSHPIPRPPSEPVPPPPEPGLWAKIRAFLRA